MKLKIKNWVNFEWTVKKDFILFKLLPNIEFMIYENTFSIVLSLWVIEVESIIKLK